MRHVYCQVGLSGTFAICLYNITQRGGKDQTNLHISGFQAVADSRGYVNSAMFFLFRKKQGRVYKCKHKDERDQPLLKSPKKIKKDECSKYKSGNRKYGVK